MDILTIAKFVSPYHLWNDELYGKIIKYSTVLSLLFVILPIVIFYDFFTKYIWILATLVTFIILISSARMVYITIFLFPFLLLPLLEMMPFEIASYFILICIWVGFILALFLVASPVRGLCIGAIPLTVGSPLLLVVTITFLFKKFPFIIDLLLYQNLLSKEIGIPILLRLYFIIFLLSPVLMIYGYRAFDIKLRQKISNNNENSASSYLSAGFFLFLKLLANMTFALITRGVILLRFSRKDIKILHGNFISMDAIKSCEEHIKSQFIYGIKQFRNQILIDTNSLTFFIIQINPESIERADVSFIWTFEKDIFLSHFVIRGNREIVKTISKYFEHEGSIFIEKGYTELCSSMEHKIFSLYNSIINCESQDCIEILRDEIKKIEEKKSQLAYVEREYISEKISSLKKELFLREYSIQNELLWGEYVHALELLLSKIEINDDTMKTCDLNIINQFFRLKEKLIQFRELRETDEKAFENLSAIKVAINNLRNIKCGLGIAYSGEIWCDPILNPWNLK